LQSSSGRRNEGEVGAAASKWDWRERFERKREGSEKEEKAVERVGEASTRGDCSEGGADCCMGLRDGGARGTNRTGMGWTRGGMSASRGFEEKLATGVNRMGDDGSSTFVRRFFCGALASQNVSEGLRTAADSTNMSGLCLVPH
jgi:hypothetical protein